MFQAIATNHVILLAILLVACSSTPQQDDSHPEDLRFDNRFTAEPSLVFPDVEIEADESIDEAFDRVVARFEAENIETFDARRAYATSAAAGFARYLTVNDPDDAFIRTNHIVFVMTEPWSEENTRDFLLSYLVMPGAPINDAGRPWFHFYSAHPLPFATAYLFSNTPMGAFEAAVLTELGTTQWSPELVGAIVERVKELLERFELADASELLETCSDTLDELFLAIPQPHPTLPEGIFEREFVPEGSLAAIGLLTGESIRVALAGAAEWEADDISDIYPRLRVRDLAEGYLRPIPMTVEMYLSEEDELTPGTYCSHMVELLEAGW